MSHWFPFLIFYWLFVCLFFFAGMRSLPVEDRESVLEAVREYLATMPFKFIDEWAEIITGTAECVAHIVVSRDQMKC